MTTTATPEFNTSTFDRTPASTLGFSAPTANLTVIPSLMDDVNYECFTSSPFTRRPSYHDCAAAISQLPFENFTHKFVRKQAGPGDIYVPLEKRDGSCRLMIDLSSDAREGKGTWLEIWNRAAQLNIVCHNPFQLDDFYGGHTQAGLKDRIYISLTLATDMPDIGESGSVAVA